MYVINYALCHGLKHHFQICVPVVWELTWYFLPPPALVLSLCCYEFTLFSNQAALIICALNDLSWGGSSLYFLTQSQKHRHRRPCEFNITHTDKQTTKLTKYIAEQGAKKREVGPQRSQFVRHPFCLARYRNSRWIVSFLSVTRCSASFEEKSGKLKAKIIRVSVETCPPGLQTKLPQSYSCTSHSWCSLMIQPRLLYTAIFPLIFHI